MSILVLCGSITRYKNGWSVMAVRVFMSITRRPERFTTRKEGGSERISEEVRYIEEAGKESWKGMIRPLPIGGGARVS